LTRTEILKFENPSMRSSS